jgi:hypothetical protein
VRAHAISAVRRLLRTQLWWIQLRELQREGLTAAWRRTLIQRAIDRTPPVETDTSGAVEVRMLTWRRDWRNAVWALKSFYAYAGVSYPLFIHDGGWLPSQAVQLQRHFPNATLVAGKEADDQVETILRNRGHLNSLRYRQKNSSTRQLFDFFLLSNADHIITLDSDLLFFRRPAELTLSAEGFRRNLYTRDSAYFYSMTLDELESSIGVRPLPYCNTGACLVRRESVDFELIERCLALPKMFDDNWVTEQTLQAVSGTLYGADYLPDTYRIEPREGGPAELVCKHYPGLYRRRLYEEGMPYLLERGFLNYLAARFGEGTQFASQHNA